MWPRGGGWSGVRPRIGRHGARGSCCGFSEEEGRRHRIAFNSLYLFSFRSINYEANGEELYNYTRGETRQLPLLGSF